LLSVVTPAIPGASQLFSISFASNGWTNCEYFGRCKQYQSCFDLELIPSLRILSMLPLEVRDSPIHGRGVFAIHAIRKGRRIIEYTGRRIPWENIPVNSEHTSLFGINDGSEVIDPSVGGNEARWINHSCDPNCEAIEDDRGRVFIYALHDISAGEELSYDYQLELDEPVTETTKHESACFCGSSNCRGTMLDLSG
jgi:SET domain-containing protein